MHDTALRPTSLRDALAGSPLRTATTLICLAAALALVHPLLKWAVIDAVWRGDAAQCRQAAGACWAYVGEKLEFFLFGAYPRALLWRAHAALALLLASLLLMSAPMRARSARGCAGLIGILLSAWLLLGGAGLAAVSPSAVGGLPLTLLLASASIVMGLPLGLALALARLRGPAWLRAPAAVFIDVMRCSPLVAVLFIASLVLPLLAKDAYLPDKPWRILGAFVLMAAAYLAEVLRGALQALPAGQREAAKALGLNPWQVLILVELPQAWTWARPAFLGVSIAFFKETSLVAIVGLYDFLGAVRLAGQDSAWMGYDTEGYLFVAAVYFALCWILAWCAARSR